MTLLLALWRQRSPGRWRCPLCHRERVTDALYRDICWSHQFAISCALAWLQVRERRFRGFWKIVRWWK